MIRMDQPLFYNMVSLLPDLDLDLFAGILCLRYASCAASLERDTGKPSLPKDLWDIVKEAGPGEYMKAIIVALRRLCPHFPWLSRLIDAVQTAKPGESDLREAIELLSHVECDGASIAQIYEYRLRKEALKASDFPGDFYTPSTIVKMMTELLEVQKGSVYDPCCGSGAMLWQACGGRPDLGFYGQTADNQSYKICKANAFLQGGYIDLGERPADIFAEDLHVRRKFDYILSNPPFNVPLRRDKFNPDDPRWRYGVPPLSNANFAWLQHIISHLSHRGRAAVILPNSTLTTRVEAERRIRREILCAGLVEAVIALPAGLFYSTKIPCCLWLLDQSRDSGAAALLADARRLRLKGGAEASAQGIAQLTELISRHRAGTLPEKTDWYAVVSLEELASKEYNLSPNFYTKATGIPLKGIEENRPRFEEVLERLSARTGESGLSELVRQWRDTQPSSQWKKTFLLEQYETFGGITKPKAYFGHGTAMVDVKTVIHNPFVPDTLTAFVDADESEIEKYQIRAGDVLLNRTSETLAELACGCVAPEDCRAVYSNYVKRLRPIRGGLLDPFYMAGYLRSAAYRQEVGRAATVYTTRVNINISQLSHVAVYYPEPAMQRKLGETLYAIFQRLKGESDEELAELLREFTDLLIEQYMTYPIRCLQDGEGGNT